MNSFCYTGRKIAIDASMSLYQFLIAVRTDEGVLTSSDGETTRYICVQKVPLMFIAVMWLYVPSCTCKCSVHVFVL